MSNAMGSRAVRWFVRANLTLVTFSALALLATIGGVLTAAAQAPAAARTLSEQAVMWGFVAAAVSTGSCALGAAYAVSHIGAAAIGAMGERPEIAGRALIFVGLAEGIAIYGLIISIMILARLG